MTLASVTTIAGHFGLFCAVAAGLLLLGLGILIGVLMTADLLRQKECRRLGIDPHDPWSETLLTIEANRRREEAVKRPRFLGSPFRLADAADEEDAGELPPLPSVAGGELPPARNSAL